MESEYDVSWHVRLSAESTLDAAARAQEMQRDPTSTANVYEVADAGAPEGGITVDLDEHQEAPIVGVHEVTDEELAQASPEYAAHMRSRRVLTVHVVPRVSEANEPNGHVAQVYESGSPVEGAFAEGEDGYEAAREAIAGVPGLGSDE